MTTFRQGAGVVVAGDVRDAVAAIDGALLSQARLCVSTLEAAQDAGVPVAETQKLYQALSSGLTAAVDGRGQVVAAVRQMTLIKRHSNIRMDDFGCPDGWSAIPSILTRGAAAQAEEV